MNVREWLQTWISVVAFPGDGAFLKELESDRARLSKAIIWLFLAALVAAILGAVRVLITDYLVDTPSFLEQTLARGGIPDNILLLTLGQSEEGLSTMLLVGLVGSLFIIPIVFLLWSTLYWVVARLLDGQGTFSVQSYLMAAYVAPLAVITALLSLIPFLGSCLVTLVGLYAFVLTFFALKTAHDLEPGKALLALFIPAAIWGLLFFCGLSLFGNSLAAALGVV